MKNALMVKYSLTLKNENKKIRLLMELVNTPYGTQARNILIKSDLETIKVVEANLVNRFYYGGHVLVIENPCKELLELVGESEDYEGSIILGTPYEMGGIIKKVESEGFEGNNEIIDLDEIKAAKKNSFWG